LSDESLVKLANYYGLKLKPDMSHTELVNTVAKKFESTEERKDFEVIDAFYGKFGCSSTQTIKNNKRQRTNTKELTEEPAMRGEQVAAKLQRGDENGCWVLANIIDFNGTHYEVQDEDDMSKKFVLPRRDVRRLDDNASAFRKGDNVLAVFPDTTSFYNASVAKNPKPPVHPNGNWDVIVRFEDDEDDSGKPPPRRIPGRFVLKRLRDADKTNND
jgi:hypothetical protein